MRHTLSQDTHTRLTMRVAGCARYVLGWGVRLAVYIWRASCRVRVINDPRPLLRARGQRYVYAMLHAHQIGAVLANDEKKMAAMVSRSRDGELIACALKTCGVLAVRGSTRGRNQDKGGKTALAQLKRLVCLGTPALLAVDGPRGPRGSVAQGIVDLGREAQAAIIVVAAVAQKPIILRKTWDLLQLPWPFSTVTLAFAETLWVAADAVPQSQAARSVRLELKLRLEALEKSLWTLGLGASKGDPTLTARD